MDVHSVGSQAATGNETWARNVAVALAGRAEARGVNLAVAATRLGAPALREMGIESRLVSDSSASGSPSASPAGSP